VQAAIFADPGRRAIDCSRLSAWAALHREARSLRARSENVVAMGFRFRFTVVICYAVCSREHESDKFVEVEMASKNDLFRTINARSPSIVEQLITGWGSLQFSEYVSDLLKEAQRGTKLELKEEVISALSELRAEHDREFPKYAILAEELIVERLEQSPNFQVINTRFPRIARRLVATWGHATFGEYINDLLNDKRVGRQGFPEGIMRALFKLSEEHDKEFPEFVLNVTDIWSLTNKIY
jgi:hypothetical protein